MVQIDDSYFIVIFAQRFKVYMFKRGDFILFALLEASLHNTAAKTDLFTSATKEDWDHCYAVAVRQGVLALAWEGVTTLPVEMQPYKQLKFKWAMSVDKYEAKHRRYCHTAQELQNFYKEHGIVAVLMKGVGFSSYYNCPSHREGGDIDIYTYSADTSSMSHREANSLADSLMKNKGIEVDDRHSYKHSNFIYNGIPVENHKMFFNSIINPVLFRKLDNCCIKYLNPAYRDFYNGEYSLLVPSDEFNTIFIPCHAFLHYGNGISLHHLYDWAVILKNCGLNMPSEVDDKHFLRAVAALTHLSNKYLNTNIPLDGFPENYVQMSEEMLGEMLSPKFSVQVPHSNKILVFIYKCRKLLRSARLARDVFGSSYTGRIKDSAFQKLINPIRKK